MLRYADLAAMTLRVRDGYDGVFVVSCRLRDHAGNELAVSSSLYNGQACEELISSARDVLASRMLEPLTHQFDEGLPVTVGCVTVDSTGISVQGRRPWTVPWGQVRKVSTGLHGQRLTVNAGGWLAKSARLDDLPNSFIAEDVIAHAVRRAGVPVQ